MRITHIELLSNDAPVFKAALIRPKNTDKFYTKAVIGLDAQEIVSTFYGFGADGARYNSLRLPEREVVFRAVLNPNYALNESYSDLRDRIFKAIASNRTGEVKLSLYSGTTDKAYLNGVITKFEVPYSSKIPEVQLTILCEDPVIWSWGEIELLDDDHISPLDSTKVVINDTISTMPHGFTFECTYFYYTGGTGFVLEDEGGNSEFRLDYPFVNGDFLFFSSVENEKTVKITRSGVDIPIVDAITPTSQWPIIFPGRNEWTWIDEGNWFLNRRATYRPAFWGV